MLRSIIFSIGIILLSPAAFSSNVEYWGEVKGFLVNENKNVLVKVYNSESAPICLDENSNSVAWPFTFNMDNPVAKEWVSMLLTSRATGSIIKLGYEPNNSGSCSVNYFYYLD